MGSKTSKASNSPPKRIVFEPELSETQKIMEIKPKVLKLRGKRTTLQATYIPHFMNFQLLTYLLLKHS